MDQRKIVLKDAAGALVGLLTLQESASDTRPLDALQRSIRSELPGRGLVVADATAEEIRAFERERRRVN